jgi:hypothetical protein
VIVFIGFILITGGQIETVSGLRENSRNVAYAVSQPY